MITKESLLNSLNFSIHIISLCEQNFFQYIIYKRRLRLKSHIILIYNIYNNYNYIQGI